MFNVAQESEYYLRVAPKWRGNSTLASYSLDIQVLEPVDGIELLAVDVEALLRTFIGRTLNVSWAYRHRYRRADAHKVVWASKNTTFEAEEGLY